MSHFNYKNLKRYENQHFRISHLASALFFPSDIEKFESDHPELFPQAPLAQARERIAELERQLEELWQKNESLKAGGGEVESASPDCLACKAESQHSDEWVKDVECAVNLTAQLMAANERGSTAFHNKEWRDLRGAPRKKAFEAVRRALPDHLKESDPRQK